ncbi:hypothetical protein AALP_AA2G057300 [Arabis alpina]|uniref:Reverse transcriptase/retrotransposon-derived protein RNase H-like domain-containing protein n=1 Tax=Arabis alpina TaxID=50452 RepID=A0A087HFJ4_ARAAL|nr:hypothetical protein AALP_AA2G057300 [Arabis alpina]
MKLNPTKCRFTVTSGEFLGYLVTHRGIKANPKQIDALIQMASPRNKREMQRLTGRVAALNRFISRSTDKCLPFYDTLRGNKQFEWSDKCEDAFKQLKEYLTTPHILAKPVTGEPLFLYIAVSETAVSVVLVREERGEQKPIFYVSKTLTDAETRYPQLEKLALFVVMASQKLRPYFQSHTIVILSTFPLRSVLHSPSQSGRLAKWVVELSEYDIEYKGRTCNKSQVLADFFIELPEHQTTKEVRKGIKGLHVDGSSSKNGSGIGIHLASPTGEILEQSFRLGFKASNNEAEYEAIIARMRLAQGLNIEHATKVLAETGVKDVEMTEAEADTELAPLTTTPSIDADATREKVVEANITEADIPEAVVPEAGVPDDLGQPEDLSSQNLLLEPKDKGTTILMDTDEEPEYGCDKPWID